MLDIAENINRVRSTLPPYVNLLCVSKFQPKEAILAAYRCGERHFGESRAQELLLKATTLPPDVKWHFIGHLQTNKIRAILPYVWSIDSVDSAHLLEAIEREAKRLDRKIRVLLEVHVAQETTKSGWQEDELVQWVEHDGWKKYEHICFAGLMGMATNTTDENRLKADFHLLNDIFDFCRTRIEGFETLSMGMSEDYMYAINEDANEVRIGSMIFGERNYA